MKNNPLADKVNKQIIVWFTLIGGFISSLVKWGSEVNMPPRPPREISPPGAHIDAWLGVFGINSHSLDYTYQNVHIAGAITLYHWLFSFAMAFLYVMIAAYWNKIRMWYGALFGIIITVATHGFLIPLLGFRNPSYANGATGWLWNLNQYELWSEIVGHLYWSFSLEICMIAVLAMFARPIKGEWTRS